MRVLVVGGGGREHALAWKIAQSPLVSKVYCAPGNAGISDSAECVPIAAGDVAALADFAIANDINLTVVGPEAPLMAGIVDLFEGRGLRIYGPSRDPARIEGSKAFAKKVMQTSGIPTADFQLCDSPQAAREAVQKHFAQRSGYSGVVVKADGLAAGKGVTVCSTQEEAMAAVEDLMVQRIYGDAGNQVVIEERLIGPEASIMVVTDGHNIVPLLPSQDHKRALEGDLGPNTGGMGAYCPVAMMPSDLVEKSLETIVRPAIETIRELGIPYRGTLYAGIMVTEDGPKCIEFNCRFGDPETQAVLCMLETDLVELLMGVVECSLADTKLRWRSGAAVSVVAASGGYPGEFRRGLLITGLEEAARQPGSMVFHSGTRKTEQGIVTDSGRVLAVTGWGDTVRLAAQNAYRTMDSIEFEGKQLRRDIAQKARDLNL